jgi:phospholipase/carboxylesterase
MRGLAPLLAPLLALLLAACPPGEDPPDDDDDAANDDDAALECGSGGSGGPLGEVDGEPGLPSYRVLTPSSYDGSAAAPLLVGLHGAYGTGQTMVDVWRDVAEEHGFIVLGPDSGSTTGWAVGSDTDRILTALDQVTRDYDIDLCRLHLSGHSSGAHMTWVVGLAHSEVFASLAPYAGALDSAEALDIWPDAVTRQIPARIDHGEDDGSIPIGASEYARDELEAAGHPVDFNPIPGSGHAWDPAATGDIWASMSAHALKTPAEVPDGS